MDHSSLFPSLESVDDTIVMFVQHPPSPNGRQLLHYFVQYTILMLGEIVGIIRRLKVCHASDVVLLFCHFDQMLFLL